MTWIVARMKWIMIVSGALTSSMIYAVFDPDGALGTTFGDVLEGSVAQIVVRNWGALIALVGGMLIYGAFHAAVRPLVLVVAGLSKVVFIVLTLIYGLGLPDFQAWPSVAADSVMVMLFTSYLVAVRRGQPARP